MRLKPIERSQFELVAEWLTRKENYQWLDFGHGVQVLSPVSLKAMTQRDIHYLRLFTSDEDDRPIGVVGLSDINRLFSTATIWALLGEKDYAGRGYTTRALSWLLTEGFVRLGLKAVWGWIAEGNSPSLRMVEKLKFSYIGRQRRCHALNGHICDRLLFDILASEHKDGADARVERSPIPAR